MAVPIYKHSFTIEIVRPRVPNSACQAEPDISSKHKEATKGTIPSSSLRVFHSCYLCKACGFARNPVISERVWIMTLLNYSQSWITRHNVLGEK